MTILARRAWRRMGIAGATPTRLGDHGLLAAIVLLSLLGAVMISSASMPHAAELYGRPFHFANRQLFFLCIGLAVALAVFRVPVEVWERYGPHLVIVSMMLLVLVLFIGTEVKGARRWIGLGLFNVQVSEMVKLFIIVYLAGYLVRRGDRVQTTFGGFLRPLLLICIVSTLLLAEPDYGAAAIIVGTAMIMLYVAGVRFYQFALLVGALGIAAFALVYFVDYRRQRLVTLFNPFDDPWGSGYQLVQALVAVGSGGMTGSGLGNSMQKLLYLPEAHTDFLFAVYAEEFGLVGVVLLIGLYAYIVWKTFALSRLADRVGYRFAGFVALGIGTWIGLQAFVNVGVNLGVLPTKGITLPMMSYGGSSAVVFAVAFALLLRIEWEVNARLRASLPGGETDSMPARRGRTVDTRPSDAGAPPRRGRRVAR